MQRVKCWVVFSITFGLSIACGVAASSDGRHQARNRAGGAPAAAPTLASGTVLALTYNVAGLPEGFSRSQPERFTPLIGKQLDRYDLVLLQESWQTPKPNPLAPMRVYHELLVEASALPFKSEPAAQPLGNDTARPRALLSDGLNTFSRFPFEGIERVRWAGCVESASDCLAFKGFSMVRLTLAPGLIVHVYDLHMEAGSEPEDDAARAAGIQQLIEHIERHSKDEALIVGGDFNLHVDREPGASQFAKLLQATQLTDACNALRCERPSSIDKLLSRSSARLTLAPLTWERPTKVFVSEAGEPLSDHEPVVVRYRWSERRD
jgi:endonuclease/exonuclease/phosphatase family metal-dependent hydrolase